MYKLSERERQSLQNADAINAILSQSSIKSGAESAKIRAREQAAARLQRSRQRADDTALQATLGARYGGGPFQGTGIEAQMLNIMLDQNIPDNDPRKIAAKQRLERERTLTTPDGVERIPGYDFGGGRPRSNFTPRVPSGDEKRGNLAVAQVESAETTNYRPSFIEEFAQETFPPSVASLFTSDPYALSLSGQRQLLSNTIYLQSGATASPEEVEKRRLEFFPQNNDSDKIIKKKAANLEAFKLDAIRAFKGRQQGPGDKYLR